MGTFLVNVFGTWLTAALTTISKFGVDYYDVDVQAVMYGLITGFCGCLTTVSTFVAELDSLPVGSSYAYSFYTHAASQFGIILIYNVYAYSTVPQNSVMPDPIKLCYVSDDMCGNLLDKLGCPDAYKVNVACDDFNDYDTYQGLCQCGVFDTDRISLLIIDAQVKNNVTNSMVPVWPKNPDSVREPTEVIDFCLTFENMCNHYFNRIGCPVELRTITACHKRYAYILLKLCPSLLT